MQEFYIGSVIASVGVAGFASGREDDKVAQVAAREFQTMLKNRAAQGAD